METFPTEVREGFSQAITPQSSETLLANMTEHAYHGMERVVLDVSSPGGEVASVMSLYEKLLSRPFELVTRNVGEIASMGNLVFLAGDRRLAAPEATFLLHPIFFDGAVKLDASDLRRARKRLERSGRSSQKIVEFDVAIARLDREDREVRRILVQRTKLSAREAATLVEEGKPVSAADALAVGIVHEVISARNS
jgi:ATP-dependent protease ClpP protease subunit